MSHNHHLQWKRMTPNNKVQSQLAMKKIGAKYELQSPLTVKKKIDRKYVTIATYNKKNGTKYVTITTYIDEFW